MKKQIIVKGEVKEILEKIRKDRRTYSIRFTKFILESNNEEFIIKIKEFLYISVGDEVIVKGKLARENSYNNDNRMLIKATKIEKINPQKLLNKFIERGKK